MIFMIFMISSYMNHMTHDMNIISITIYIYIHIYKCDAMRSFVRGHDVETWAVASIWQRCWSWCETFARVAVVVSQNDQ